MIDFTDLLAFRFNLTEIVGVAKRNIDMPVKSPDAEEKLFDLIDELPNNIIIPKDTAKVFLRCIFRTVYLRHKSLKLGAQPKIDKFNNLQVDQIIATYKKYYPEDTLVKSDFEIKSVENEEYQLLNEDDITQVRKLLKVITLLLFIVSQQPVVNQGKILKDTSEPSLKESDIEKILDKYNLGEHTKMIYMSANALYK